MRGIKGYNAQKKEPTLGFDNKIAFIVGIENYQKVSKLKTPINDCKKIATVLHEKYDFQIYEQYDLERESLKEWIENEIYQVVGENDCVVFYFAGHGKANENELGTQGFICPIDTDKEDDNTLVSMSFLYKHLLKLNCKHCLIILDCCFAGAFRWAEKYRDVLTINDTIFQQHYRYYTQNPSWQVITSSSHTQKALDVLGVRDIENNNHSPFAKCLIEGLEGKADSNNDKIITAADLFIHLQNHVPIITGEYNKLQNVGFFQLEKHGNGEFMFFPKDFDSSQLTEKNYTNPYKGLEAYGENDSTLFFGRDKAISELLEKVKHNHFIVVVGPSGLGKSSLVRAGIIPKLKAQGLKIGEMRPGKDPISGLSNLNNDFDVLIIDQFEEIITQSNPIKAEEFIKILRGYIDIDKKIIILTVRLDFESQIEKNEIEDDWQNGRFKIQPFTFEELREIIITPSARVGRFIDDKELVNEIANEVFQYQSSLPLLSFTLSELFEKCKNDLYRNIRYEDYKALGGVTGSLQQAANRIVESFNPQEQQTLKNIMLRMVSLSTGTLASKRVMLKDLVFDSDAENQRVQVVKNKLIEARLIVPNTDSNNQEFIEPTHDALVHAWAKLSEWIKNREEESLLLQNKLTDAVNDYETHKNKKRLWHNDARLDLIKEELFSDQKWLNKREEDFVQQSLKLEKRNRSRTILIVVSIIVTLLGLTVWAFSQQKEATIQRDNAQAQQKIAEGNLNKYLFEQKDKNNQRLPILLQQSETFAVAEEYAKEKVWLDSIQDIIQQFNIEKDSLKVPFDSLKIRQQRNLKNLKLLAR